MSYRLSFVIVSCVLVGAILGVPIGRCVAGMYEECDTNSASWCSGVCQSTDCRNVIDGDTCNASAVKHACVPHMYWVCSRWNSCPGKCLDDVTECVCPTNANICG